MRNAQVPWLTVFVLLVILVFGLALAQIYLITIIKVVATVIILYVVFLRAYTEIIKYRRGERYLKCALLALILVLFANHFLDWFTFTAVSALEFVTAVAALTLIFAQIALARDRRII